MQTNAKMGTALVGGYLLGRTKKAKMAMGLGMFLAGKKLNLDPKRLAKMAAESPLVSGLSEQVRKDLMDGTKSALTSAVTQRVNGIADSLRERTLEVNDAGSDRPDDEDAEEFDERAEAEDVPEDDEGEESEVPRASSDSGVGGTEKRPRTESGGGRKAKSAAAEPARKQSAGTAAARKTSGARKTADGARKSASTAARKTTTTRGGGNG